VRFATLCSGIGAPEVAAHRLGMTPVFFSEIEPFPCAVLAYHWPDVPNYGDMTAWRDWPHHDLDLLIAGTPCQAFSVAGLRQGLDDARGNLTLEFARYADHVRPRFVLWENVPGVLSDKSNAFGCLLAGLAGCDAQLLPRGGRWTNAGFVSGPKRQIAWRVLDAQHFGVAQRRRRVWLLAGDVERGAGGWACARALFPEQGGVRGDSPACGAARKEGAGASGGGVAVAVYKNHGQDSRVKDLGDTCSTVSAKYGTGGGNTPLIATYDMRGNGDGENVNCLSGHHAAQHHVAFSQNGQEDVRDLGEFAGTLCADSGAHQTSYVLSTYFEPRFPRTSGGQPQDELAHCLRSDTNTGDGQPCVAVQSTVRRLTPRECERLQGFPDDHTAVQYRNKPACDGPRYKALGNSMAVPCVQFILENLQKIAKENA
jgi:DNA (cytosine-5)-methyltransferase 1